MPVELSVPSGRTESQRSQIVVAPMVSGYRNDGGVVCVRTWYATSTWPVRLSAGRSHGVPAKPVPMWKSRLGGQLDEAGCGVLLLLGIEQAEADGQRVRCLRLVGHAARRRHPLASERGPDPFPQRRAPLLVLVVAEHPGGRAQLIEGPAQVRGGDQARFGLGLAGLVRRCVRIEPVPELEAPGPRTALVEHRHHGLDEGLHGRVPAAECCEVAVLQVQGPRQADRDVAPESGRRRGE